MKIKTLAIVLTVALSGCTQGSGTNTSASRTANSQTAATGAASDTAKTGANGSTTSPLPQPQLVNSTESAANNKDAVAANVDPAMKARLNSCLVEAKQLAKLRNGSYRASVDELYRNLRATQAYANLAGELSSTTTELMTPLYQYRVTDSCNTISQLLLKELKKGSIITGN